jgi:CheY-like chemotaxis protein
MGNFAAMNILHNMLLSGYYTDDCTFFDMALKVLPLKTNLTILNDGEQLMSYLFSHSDNLPDVLFPDLSISRKTGFECLSEIKETNELKGLPAVMCSTSYPQKILYEQDIINVLLKIGAQTYVRKPGDIEQLKRVIYNALITVTEKTEKVRGEIREVSIPSSHNIFNHSIKTS